MVAQVLNNAIGFCSRVSPSYFRWFLFIFILLAAGYLRIRPRLASTAGRAVFLLHQHRPQRRDLFFRGLQPGHRSWHPERGLAHGALLPRLDGFDLL